VLREADGTRVGNVRGVGQVDERGMQMKTGRRLSGGDDVRAFLGGRAVEQRSTSLYRSGADGAAFWSHDTGFRLSLMAK